MAIITLTTDFGRDSPYVAQMKGVILSLSPSANIVDITHAIPPQDIFAGALALADAAPWFPPETIHVAVVDPGVGTSRRAIAARIGEQWYLAPDNGLLTGVLRCAPASAIVSLENRAFFQSNVSCTFHGRDIFAPVAAHLGRGIPAEELGPRIDALVQIDWPTPQTAGDQLVGEIISIDSFGNLITNITRRDVQDWRPIGAIDVHCGGQIIRGIANTYGAHAAGEFVALFGSTVRLEIAVVNGSAARRLQAGRGQPVELWAVD
jgi:S-adenosylmethionine hydrolase